jgi:hypothetical protein
MCKLGERSERLEALGVRVRLVDGLAESALYFRKRALMLLDANLEQDDADAVIDELSAEIQTDREWAGSLQAQMKSLGESAA